jgi:hypothetical protein
MLKIIHATLNYCFNMSFVDELELILVSYGKINSYYRIRYVTYRLKANATDHINMTLNLSLQE